MHRNETIQILEKTEASMDVVLHTVDLSYARFWRRTLYVDDVDHNKETPTIREVAPKSNLYVPLMGKSRRATKRYVILT